MTSNKIDIKNRTCYYFDDIMRVILIFYYTKNLEKF